MPYLHERSAGQAQPASVAAAGKYTFTPSMWILANSPHLSLCPLKDYDAKHQHALQRASLSPVDLK